MSRLTLSPKKIVELLPEPIIDLISELSGSDDPGTQEEVAEYLRKAALQANAIFYRRRKAALLADLPEGALAEYTDDDPEHPENEQAAKSTSTV